jgi:NitT/TauT family transport system substrate-binding protein
MFKKTIIILVLLLLTLGCTKKTEPGTSGKSDKEIPRIKLGHVGQDHHSALYVAAENPDLFKKKLGVYLKVLKHRVAYELISNGKKIAVIETIKVKGGAGMPAAMERGEIQIGFGGVAAEAFFIDKGAKAKIIAPLQTEGDMLVMKPDCPATDWKTWVAWVKAQKKPVMMGYKAPVAVAKLIFVRALKHEGVKWAMKEGEGVQVVLVHTKGESKTTPALQAGAIDGFVMNQPVPAITTHKKLGKIVCHLSDLPPQGRWKQHPCCALYARTDLLDKEPAAVKAFLKAVLYATHLLNTDKELGPKATTAWTKVNIEIEKSSVPLITYLAVPTEEWLEGMRAWAEVMNEINKFKKNLKGKKPNDIVKEICDFRLLKEAWDELREKKVIPGKPVFGSLLQK